MDDSPGMKTFSAERTIKTTGSPEFIDVTDEISQELSNSGIRSGMVTVFALQESCAFIVNERESGLLSDIKSAFERLDIDHAKNRKTMIGSTSVVLPAVDGKLRLGTWQRVLLVELDEPAPRSFVVQVMGE
jgi:secondary thiamine-phosphate synthase enzyme